MLQLVARTYQRRCGIFIILCLLCFSAGIAQTTIIIRDSVTHSSIPSTVVSVDSGNLLAITDDHGICHFSLDKTTHTVVVYHISYIQRKIKISTGNDTVLITMQPKSNLIDPVEVFSPGFKQKPFRYANFNKNINFLLRPSKQAITFTGIRFSNDIKIKKLKIYGEIKSDDSITIYVLQYDHKNNIGPVLHKASFWVKKFEKSTIIKVSEPIFLEAQTTYLLGIQSDSDIGLDFGVRKKQWLPVFIKNINNEISEVNYSNFAEVNICPKLKVFGHIYQ